MKKITFNYIFLFICLVIQNNNIIAMKNNNINNIYSNTRPFQCDTCLNYYKSKSRLNQHKRSVHVAKLFQCILCCNRFKTKSHLKIHQGVYSKKNHFPCLKSFRYKISFINHQNDHYQRYQTQLKQNSLILQQALLNYQNTFMSMQNNFTYNANDTIFNDLAGASDYKTTNDIQQDPFLTLQYK